MGKNSLSSRLENDLSRRKDNVQGNRGELDSAARCQSAEKETSEASQIIQGCSLESNPACSPEAAKKKGLVASSCPLPVTTTQMKMNGTTVEMKAIIGQVPRTMKFLRITPTSSKTRSIPLTTTIRATTIAVSALSENLTVAKWLLKELLASYYSARENKRNTQNQSKFERELVPNIIALFVQISKGTYKVGRSIAFIIFDPVQREIFRRQLSRQNRTPSPVSLAAADI